MNKNQLTLDNFFINSNKDNINKKNINKKNNIDNCKKEIKLKNYFYLLWTNKNRPDIQAYWTDKKPERINFIKKVKCNYFSLDENSDNYFYLCGYLLEEKNNNFFKEKEKFYKNTHFLKSHLQKNIRKQNENLAIQTCNHLLRLDSNDLLRRLPIIILEDVYLHEGITTLIWIMIANTVEKFKIKVYMCEWILGLIYILCKIDKRDIREKLDDENKNINIIDELNSYNVLGEEQISILYSLHLRIAYGGTSSDIKMIRQFIDTWYKRFFVNVNNKKQIDKTIIRPISINVKELKLTDWDISAVDYHCFPKFLEHLHTKFPEYTLSELKKIVWNNSSGINKRTLHKEYETEKWNEIKNYVSNMQKYLLDTMY